MKKDIVLVYKIEIEKGDNINLNNLIDVIVSDNFQRYLKLKCIKIMSINCSIRNLFVSNNTVIFDLELSKNSNITFLDIQTDEIQKELFQFIKNMADKGEF